MKVSYHVIIALIYIMVATVSCRKELDRAPLDQFSSENFWTSEQNVLLALTGVYRGSLQMATIPLTSAEFAATDWWSYHGLLYLELATDNAYDRRGDNSAFNMLTNGALVNTNGYLANYWSLSYRRIARCNYFLENIRKAAGVLDEAKIARMSAEARFIRACQYFYLSQHFGSVPLVERTLALEEANTVTKTSKDQVLAFAVSEFNSVLTDLPRQGAMPATERGRVTQQAALSFLGRAYLAQESWANAAEVYKQVIDLNENIIDPNFRSLFNGSNEASKEIIFATQYVQDLAPNAMMQHHYPAILGGWMLHCPLGSLVESYEFNDGTPFSYTSPRYSPSNLGLNRDPRLRYTVLYHGQTFRNTVYNSHPNSTASPDQLTTTKQATRTGYAMQKFSSEEFSGGNLQNSGVDIPIIRYAEVLLSYLEAVLESGATIDRTLLDATINQVRGRTGVNMPPVSETNPTLLRTILRRERRNELALEGIRYWDLLRWKTIGQVLSGDFYGAPYPDATNLRRKPGTTIQDPYSRWFVTSKTFRIGQDELWPVPLMEVNINPNLR